MNKWWINALQMCLLLALFLGIFKLMLEIMR